MSSAHENKHRAVELSADLRPNKSEKMCYQITSLTQHNANGVETNVQHHSD